MFSLLEFMGSQGRIQDFVKGGGGQLLRPKVTDVAKQSCVSNIWICEMKTKS